MTANSVHPAGPMKKLTELNETDIRHFAHTNGPANVNDWMLCDLGEEFKIKAIRSIVELKTVVKTAWLVSKCKS